MNSLDGEIKIYANGTYIDEWDSTLFVAILDADIYTFNGTHLGSVIQIQGVVNDVIQIQGRI
jgi:hypothetical protein